MYRCKKCGSEVYAHDLMPRIIAINHIGPGFTDYDWAPERYDKDEYDSSQTIAFGCLTETCDNWIFNFGLMDTDKVVVNSLEDVAEVDDEPKGDNPWDSAYAGGPYSQGIGNL